MDAAQGSAYPPTFLRRGSQRLFKLFVFSEFWEDFEEWYEARDMREQHMSVVCRLHRNRESVRRLPGPPTTLVRLKTATQGYAGVPFGQGFFR